MPDVKILCFHSIFLENSLILSQRSGFKFVDGKYEPADGDLLIIFGSHEEPHLLLKVLEDFKNIVVVVIQTEQITSQHFENKYYLSLLRHNRCYVFDWSEYNANKLKSKFDIKPISLYSFDFYGKEPYPELKDRPIDILFCGAKTPKREKVINELKNNYPDYKFFVDFSYGLTEPNKINSVLCKSKIVLNIPSCEDNALETHRIIQAKSCGCEVLTYYSSCDDLNKSYSHYCHFSNNFNKALKDINKIIDNPKKNHKEWNKDINQFTIADNVEKLKKIISLHYKTDEKK